MSGRKIKGKILLFWVLWSNEEKKKKERNFAVLFQTHKLLKTETKSLQFRHYCRKSRNFTELFGIPQAAKKRQDFYIFCIISCFEKPRKRKKTSKIFRYYFQSSGLAEKKTWTMARKKRPKFYNLVYADPKNPMERKIKPISELFSNPWTWTSEIFYKYHIILGLTYSYNIRAKFYDCFIFWSCTFEKAERRRCGGGEA